MYTNLFVTESEMIVDTNKIADSVILNKIKEILVKEAIDVCYLFGSFGTIRCRESSDIDIAIIGNISDDYRWDLKYKLEQEIGKEFDFVRVENISEEIRYRIYERNIILFCKDKHKDTKFKEEVKEWTNSLCKHCLRRLEDGEWY